jgi:hypothetical protein
VKRLLVISAALVAVLGTGCGGKEEAKFQAVTNTLGNDPTTSTTTDGKFHGVTDRLSNDADAATTPSTFAPVSATLDGGGTKTFDDLTGRQKAEFTASCIEIRGALKKLLDSWIAGDLLGKDDPATLTQLISGYESYLDLCSDAEPLVAPGMASMLSDLKEKQAG